MEETARHFSLAEPPKLDLGSLGFLGPNNEIRLRPGDTLDLPIPIKGAPKPIVVWEKDGKALGPTAEITDKEDLTKVVVPNVKRGDSGVYKIKLKNAFGEDEAAIKVVVMGECCSLPGLDG